MTSQTTKNEKTKNDGSDGPVIIKKYANRRLYNTASSSYVTLDFLSEMVKRGEEFEVFDAKTGDDITRSVLTQIIFEEENKGQNLLPIQFLRQLIGYYGDNLQSVVPSYLEMSMDAFTKNSDGMRKQMREAFGANSGYSLFEDTIRKNMSLYGQAMKMFSPVAGIYPSTGNAPTGSASDTSPAADDIDTLKAQMAALQRQLEKIEQNKS